MVRLLRTLLLLRRGEWGNFRLLTWECRLCSFGPEESGREHVISDMIKVHLGYVHLALQVQEEKGRSHPDCLWAFTLQIHECYLLAISIREAPHEISMVESQKWQSQCSCKIDCLEQLRDFSMIYMSNIGNLADQYA